VVTSHEVCLSERTLFAIHWQCITKWNIFWIGSARQKYMQEKVGKIIFVTDEIHDT